MSQNDMDIADQAGASFLADINSALQALAGNNSGATEPATRYAYQWWADTTTGLLKIRNSANTAWITVGTLASTYLGLGFTAGTRMPFNQTSAPTGWTKDTTAALNDTIIRIVTGTVGSGGSTALSTFNAQTSTAGYTLTTADIPSHSHSVTDPGHAHTAQLYGNGGAASAYGGASATATSVVAVNSATTGISIGNTGSGGAHSHGITTSIKYNDFIIASKN